MENIWSVVEEMDEKDKRLENSDAGVEYAVETTEEFEANGVGKVKLEVMLRPDDWT